MATSDPPCSGALDATENPYAITRVSEAKDQYLVGDSLLVAPIAPGVGKRRVALPPGKWFDFFTGAFAGDGGTIEVEPPLDRIPLFVRDGGLIPLIPERPWAPRPGEQVPLEIRHYGVAPGSIALYDDDGKSFNHRKGEWLGITMDWRDKDRRLALTLTPGSKVLAAGPRSFEVKLAGSNSTRSVTFDGRPVNVTLS